MRSSIFIFFYLFAIFTLCQCTTTPSHDEASLPKSPSSYSSDMTHSPKGSYNDIDLIALSRELKMNQNLQKVGYEEKSFDSCRIRSNRSKKPLCKRMYLGRVHYKIMCRDSSGTVQKVSLEPMSHQSIRWKNGKHKGMTRTNAKGFGYIQFVTPSSSKSKHLYLYMGRKVARKRMADLWKLVFPKNWCY